MLDPIPALIAVVSLLISAWWLYISTEEENLMSKFLTALTSFLYFVIAVLAMFMGVYL